MSSPARPATVPKISTATSFDADRIRAEFPILSRRIGKHPLVYLDSAATTQKPACVIEAVTRFYEETNSNVHRGVHRLSAEATDAYEAAREKIRLRLGARETAEVVWVRGTTEGINLVAQSWGRPRLGRGDEILVTEMEHHSNIVPWQILGQQTGATLKVAPIADDGSLRLDAFEHMLTERTRIVAVTHASNALGTINPIARIVELALAAGAVVVVDGAQAAAHLPIDVAALGCDFYAFSGHKMFGPTGIGALYGKREHFESMPPWMGGGDMISNVTFRETTYNELPYRFEAGTPNIAGAIGLGAAADRLAALDPDALAAHEDDLLDYGSGRRRTRPRCSRSSSTASTPTTSARFSTAAGSPSARGTTARSRSCSDSRFRPRPAPRFRSIMSGRTWTPSSRASGRSGPCSVDPAEGTMDPELRELYQQVILDHHRNPRNFHGLSRCQRCADGYNPLCGDRIRVALAHDGEGAGERVADVGFTGQGCAICTASASMMTECLKGKTTEEAERIFEGFHELLTNDSPEEGENALGKLTVFAGVREFPMRVKCATLPWHTFQAALHNEDEAVSTE